MSRIRANTITNQNANGAPNFPDGITVTGVVTATVGSQNITGDLTVSGDVGIGGTLTYEDVTNVDSVGIVTARSGIRVTSTTAGIAVGTNAMVSGRADNVLHLHKASGGTADGPTIYFTNQQTGVTANDGLTIGLNDTQSPYIWNRENTATRFGTNNAERLRIGPAGQIGLGGANYGTAGQALLSGGASSAVSWGTIAQKIVQVKQVYYSNTPVSFSNQAGTLLNGNTHFPMGARFGGSFTKSSSTSKILVFGKMSYVMSSTNVHGVVCWVVGDESNYVNLMDDSRNYGTYGSSYAHMNTALPGIFFNTAYNAGTVTVYAAPAVNGGRSHTGILNGNPHSNSIQGNSDTPNKDAHSMMTIVEVEFS